MAAHRCTLIPCTLPPSQVLVKDSLALTVALDPAMTPDAVRVALYYAAQGEGPHPYERDTLSLLLSDGGEKRIRAALRRAELCGYLKRQHGGKRTDSFVFSPPQVAGEKVSPPRRAVETIVSPAARAGESELSQAAWDGERCATTTDTSSPPTSTRARTPETDLARLRVYLGEYAECLDKMCDSAEHPPNWAASIHGKFGATGTQTHAYVGIPADRWPAVLADAISDWATNRKAYTNRHFEGFVRKAADSERASNRPGSGSSASAHGGAPRPTGTDGARDRIPIE
jgi:hypothetical protein